MVDILTSLNFLTIGQPWPPEGERKRIQKYRENCLLFEGRHELVYKDWTRLLREDVKATLELILNWHKRLSLLWADLLLSEPPRIMGGDLGSAEQLAVERLVEDNSLLNTSYEVVLDISRAGTGLFKVRYDGRGIIEALPPTLWFPVVSPTNIREVVAHVLAWRYSEKVGYKEVQFLRAEIHERGKITTRVYRLADDGQIKALLEENEEATGVDQFLIVPIHNVLTTDRVTGIDDYSDLDTIIQEIEVRIAQISRILDKHSDPNMHGPETALSYDVTGESSFLSGGKYFPVGPGESIPGYVTWDGQLSAAFQQIDVLMEQLYFLSETSPAAFGQLKSGLAESGSALRRLMMAPLLKTSRLRMRLDPGLREALWLASLLEKAQGMPNAVVLEDISILWQDGLPKDEPEETQTESTRYTAGLTSLESALKRMFGLEGEALEEELARIRASEPKPIVPPGGGDE